MADNGPSARSVANSVLNSTSPTYLPEDQELGGALEQLIRMGDQKNPSGGFSYLDNIARVLTDSKLKSSGDVLLEQLLGRPVAPTTYGRDKQDVGPIPGNRYPMLPLPRGASDIPSDPRSQTGNPYMLGTPMDQSQSPTGFFGKPLQRGRRRT